MVVLEGDCAGGFAPEFADKAAVEEHLQWLVARASRHLEQRLDVVGRTLGSGSND
jgi:hypothetical protein